LTGAIGQAIIGIQFQRGARNTNLSDTLATISAVHKKTSLYSWVSND